jgi:hypothetical protein
MEAVLLVVGRYTCRHLITSFSKSFSHVTNYKDRPNSQKTPFFVLMYQQPTIKLDFLQATPFSSFSLFFSEGNDALDVKQIIMFFNLSR